MSVQTETNQIQYLGNNSTTTAYPVPFYFLEKSDLKVVVTPAIGDETALNLGTDYAVSGEGNALGGNITTVSAWNSSYKITIYREVPATQTTVYEENADFPAKSEERALDKLTMLTQQLSRKLKQCFRFRESDGETNETPKVINSVFGLGADGLPVFRTAADLASWLNLSQDFFEAPTKTFANAAERNITAPGFPGQIGSQRDERSLWIATGTTAGSWFLYAPGINSITLAMLADGLLTNSSAGRAKMADGFLSANPSGRAKMADAFISLAKLGAGIFTADSSGRAPFTSGFINQDLCASGLWNTIAPSGAVLQTVYAEYLANADLSIAIPLDNSVPEVTEGTQILSAAITPSSSSNKILIKFKAAASSNSGNNIASVFAGGQFAIAAVTNGSTNGLTQAMVLDYLHSPASTSLKTYTVRVGGPTTIRLNGDYLSPKLGGAMRATLTLQEIKA